MVVGCSMVYVVTAPSLALLTVLAYLAKTPRLNRGSGALKFLRRDFISSSEMLRVSLRLGMSKVMVSPSRTAAMGPPSWASGATWPTMRPRVAPEKRPSVRSATVSREFRDALDGGGDGEHLAHAGAAARAFVADDEDVVGVDLAGFDGGECSRLRESKTRAGPV